MCLLFLYLCDERTEGKYRLIIADNRDEYWDRPTKPLSWSDNEEYLCGHDLVPGREGGTWLGVSKTGKIGILLNVLGILDTTKLGRGHLITNFLSDETSCQQFVEENVSAIPDSFKPFHLILLDLYSSQSDSLCCDVSGKHASLTTPLSGIFSRDNAEPGTYWQKSKMNEVRFDRIVQQFNNIEQKDQLVEKLLNLLQDQTSNPDDRQLRKQAALTHMTEDLILERSAPFVCSPTIRAGTRTHSIVLVDFDGNCEFIEKTLETPIVHGDFKWETNSFQFRLRSDTEVS